MNANLEDIDELILLFLQGRITSEDKVRLQNWLALNDENKAHFRKMYLIWKTGSLTDLQQNEKQISDAYQKTGYKIHEAELATLTSIDTGRKINLSILKFAAILVIMLGLGGVLSYLFLQRNLLQNDTQTISEINVPLGSKSRIILPDKTEVWLNAGSKLTYSKAYGKISREVSLVGEGYFKVAKQKDKPFIVHTVKANIKALGTEFNVKAYPEENTIETILVEGSVAINKIQTSSGQESADDKTIVLKPGQKMLIYKSVPAVKAEPSKPIVEEKTATEDKAPMVAKIENDISLTKSNTEIETSWKDPSWVIQGEEVKELLVKIGRRYNVSISLKDDKLNKYKFSGIIENETLEQVFNYMSLTIPMSYSIDKGKAEILLNKKLESKYKPAYKNQLD